MYVYIQTERECTFKSCYIFKGLSGKCQYFENIGIFHISSVTRYLYLIFSIQLLLKVLEWQGYVL